MQQQRESKPRVQQLVFSTKKAGRKAKERQGQGHQAVAMNAKPAPEQIEEEQQQHESSMPCKAQERRRHRSIRNHSQSVKHMRPSRALLQSDRTTVAQCVRMMVERKTDASLLVNKSGLLTGILTDRDVAVKVVAVNRDPRTTLAHEVMTPDPLCVSASSSAIDALKKMISGQFRHLPVTDNDKVVGILDIAKCLYEAITKLEHAYQISSDRLEKTVTKLQRSLSGSTEANLFESLRRKLFLPTLSAIIMDGSEVPVLGPTSTAMDAARMMMIHKTSAVMICDEADRTEGIFTSKDLMRRVVALSLKPNQCMLSSVMTINPQTATLGTTILETLHSMHNGSFLHVPVFGDGGKLVGIVDVLQVTHGVVQQMGTFQSAKSDTVQPLWDQFRTSLRNSNDSGEHEKVEDDHSNVNKNDFDAIGTDIPGLVGRQAWNESQLSTETGAAGNPALLDEEEHAPDVFVYKLADSYGNNHRFTSSAEFVHQLLVDVQNQLGDNTIRRIFYVDDEGDHVLLSEDSDLKDAVNRARTWGNKYIRLTVPHYQLMRRALAHNSDTAIGMVVYAAAVAALAGASFLLSRRK